MRNGGEYVKECIGSIRGQTLDDFSLIVLDNCSTDGTPEWIASLGDPRITIIPAAKPLSIEDNWGRIVEAPKNEFITMIGHDDILDKHYLAVMDRLIRDHPAASLYQAHFRYIDSAGATLRRCKPMDERQSAAEFLAFFLTDIIDTMGTGFMIRSADYDAVGGMPPYPSLLFADFELWIELTRKGYKATAPEECFAFRLHQSTTATSSDLAYQYAFERFIGYLEKVALADLSLEMTLRRYGLQFIEGYCKGLTHRLLRTPISKRGGQTVRGFVSACKGFADRLVPGNQFDPYRRFSMKLARIIDRYWLTRRLFLLFKKLYAQPIYS